MSHKYFIKILKGLFSIINNFIFLYIAFVSIFYLIGLLIVGKF
jgi:hypothetical protein